MRTPRLVAVAVFTLLLVACGNKGDTPRPDEPTTHEVEVRSGFEVRLRSLSSTPNQPGDVRSVEGRPLGQRDTEALLERLPPLEHSSDESNTRFFDGGPTPPPRDSTTAAPVNPKETSDEPPPSSREPEKLRVVRKVPTGEPSKAHRVSVTFSKPMVSLGTREQASEKMPVELKPEVAGTWRWVGTSTVVFRPSADELPMATGFTATVSGSVEAADGTALGEDVRWEFRTPPVRVEYFYANLGSDPLRPLLLLQFNGPVEPDRILEDVDLLGERFDHRLRLASRSEIQAADRASRLVQEIPDGEWAAFKPKSSLRPATTYSLEVDTDVPSEQIEAETSTVFRTYSPLRLDESRCTGWECSPDSSLRLKFNNQLDDNAFEPSMVDVSPTPEDPKVEVSGNAVLVRGEFKTGSSYRVTVDDSIADVFGQTLDVSVSREFYVPLHEPQLEPIPSMIVADPDRRPTIGVPSASLKYLDVTAYRVAVADWPRYYHRKLYDNAGWIEELREEAGTERIEVQNPRSGLVQTRVDLSRWIQQEHGHLVLKIEPGEPLDDAPDPYLSMSERWVWVQVTDLAPNMYGDSGGTYAWVTELSDGEPVKGAVIEALRDADWPTMETGPEGLALEGRTLDDATYGYSNAFMVSRGDDTAIVPRVTTPLDGWHGRRQRSEHRWHVYTDRGLYRPGETIDVKGWVRRIDSSDSGLLRQVDRASTLDWELVGPGHEEIAQGNASLSEAGGFHVETTLPEDVHLGQARFGVSLEETPAESNAYFDIREFRTPKFDIDVTASAGPFVAGDTARATVSASYYRGGSLSGSDVTWRVESRTGDYAPPGWREFSFGTWSSPWHHREAENKDMDLLDGVLGKGGVHRLGLETGPADVDLPISMTADAIVQDVSRQTVAGSAAILVHPAEAYIGVRTPRHFVERGEQFEVEAVGVSIDGEPLEGRRMEISMGAQTCERAAKGETPVTCTFEARRGGSHVITGEIFDRDGRTSVSQRRIWVPGHDPGAGEDIDEERVDLIPDRSTYHAGDTAEILVRSPFETAQGLLLVARDDVVATRRFEVEDHSARLNIDVDAADIPNTELTVQLVGRGDVDGRSGPVHARGGLGLDVSASARRLDVSLHPQTVGLKPSGELTVGLEVERPDGSAAAESEVALAVVDEAVLATAGYELDDPLSSFYPKHHSSIGSASFRRYVRLSPEGVSLGARTKKKIDIKNLGVNKMLASENLGSGRLEDMFKNKDGISSRMNTEMEGDPPTLTPQAEPGSDAAQIQLRQDLRPAAYFGPRITTNEEGEATVSFELPDNLTRWRLMAVAVDGAEYFGTAEETVTVRKPVSISPSLPRFLNLGDQAQLPVVVHNQTRRDRTIKLATRSSNLGIDGPRGVSVDVPALERVEVQFPSRTKGSGTAQVQLAASSGDWADGVEESIPVHRPATTEAFATYGSVESENATITHPVRKPEDVIPDYGSLNVTTSSTALQKLTDAFIYLVDYPYECTEQASSRMLGIAALRDVLGVFESASLPDAEELKASIQEDIELLENRQRYGGGFTLWDDGTDVWPYASLHATLALHRVEEAGYEVPADMLEDAAEYASEIDAAGLDPDMGEKLRNTVHAYALYVLHEIGEGQPKEAADLLSDSEPGETISLEGIGWLLSALGDEPVTGFNVERTLRSLRSRVTETASSAHFATDYSEEDGYLIMHSTRRADAVLLESWMEHRPDSDLVQKLVRGLQENRTRGRWANTQENVFVLRALRKYFDTYESKTPDFVARTWLGDGYLGKRSFRGRTAQRHRMEVPMGSVIDETGLGPEQRAPLTIDKQGPGRLYYRIGLDYAPESHDLESMDAGFTVNRHYEAIDDPQDAIQRDDGTWVVEAGSRVRVTLEMVARARRNHVALVDPLPAGLEAIIPALATTGEVPDGKRRWWYGHDNLRTERVEAFATRLRGGVYTYEYVARATTPGEFVVPPAKAEEMYHPETFGRTGTARMVVK